MDLNKSPSEIDDRISEILSELELTISQLESLKRALKNPTPISSSTANTSLRHLLSLPDLNIEENLSDSESYFLTSSFKSLEHFNVLDEKKNTLVTSSESSTSESSVGSLLSKIFRKTKKISIPSINSENDKITVGSSAIKLAQQVIEKIENNGQAGTPEMSALSHVIGKKIIVFSSSEKLLNNHEAGRSQPGKPVEIQFHNGYWSQVGVQKSESIQGSLYNCLFSAIAGQTKKKPTDLHPKTIEYMKEHVKNLTTKIDELMKKEECQEIVLLITGRKEMSNNVSLDNSEFQLQEYSQSCSSNDQPQIDDENLHKSSEAEQATEFLSNHEVELTQPVKRLVLVLRHNSDNTNDPQHDVFIQTILP